MGIHRYLSSLKRIPRFTQLIPLEYLFISFKLASVAFYLIISSRWRRAYKMGINVIREYE